jgi:cytochrome b561
MQWRNSPARYGIVTKTFHWVMAIIVITLLVVGLTMEDIGQLALKLKVYDLHKSFGILILLLAALRLGWHMISKKPPFVDNIKPWERWAAHAAHTFLYIALFGMPLAGWLLSSAAGRSVKFFGLFTLPDLVGADPELRSLFGTIHWGLGMMLIAAIALHAAGALKHHFISRDATLRRMLPFG